MSRSDEYEMMRVVDEVNKLLDQAVVIDNKVTDKDLITIDQVIAKIAKGLVDNLSNEKLISFLYDMINEVSNPLFEFNNIFADIGTLFLNEVNSKFRSEKIAANDNQKDLAIVETFFEKEIKAKIESEYKGNKTVLRDLNRFYSTIFKQ